ncbi:MAG: T9SS type A sorting domain-containing protein [Lewinellaceae bacterium]|nr:T9SS type A sorting domain-containing protein [Lewinellaceae bacterium]
MKALSTLLCLVLLFSFLACSPTPGPHSKKEYPADWFYRQRAYPHGRIDKQLYLDALREKMARERIAGRGVSSWEFAGPTNIGGRITDVEMDPANMDVIYAGAASGGIFKSEDQGESWRPVFDEALSLSIGDIAMAPSDPDILYVGTGEANAGGGSLAYDGAGIYKSIDGGDSWEHLGMENIGSVGKVLVHPHDPNRVWVAAMGTLFANSQDRGVYRTADGGQSWEQVLFVSDSTGAIDLALHLTDPDIIYAATWERIRRPDRRQYGGPTSGIYRSVDGGDSWTELSVGLPQEDNGRIGLAVTPAAPDMVFALYTDEIGYHKDLFQSFDKGESWMAFDPGALQNILIDVPYAWWFGRLYVHPEDPATVFMLGLFTYRTKNGGASWENINYNDSVDVHVDPHALFIHPLDPEFVVLGNDGGLYISRNGGDTWEHKNSLPITQFYTCEIDYLAPERLYGGAQDNGTNRTLAGGQDDWQQIFGGDGMVVKVDPANNSVLFVEYQYGGLFRSDDGGNTWQNAAEGISPSERRNWKTPYVLAPGNPQRIFYGTSRLFRSDNRGDSWTAISPDLTGDPPPQTPFFAYGTITTIAVSPADEDVIYVGTDNGMIWRTTNGGGLTGWDLLSADLPDRWTTAVATHPSDPNTAYVTFSGYRYNEYLPHVFQTKDGGATWNDISAGLPEVPANDIAVDPENPEWLYLATDVGVFFSTDEGLNWEVLGMGLPNVPVTGLCLHNPTRKLVAATYGRSMYAIQLDESVAVGEPEWNVEGMEVFPNPASEVANIRFQMRGEAAAEILLFDNNGRLVERAFQGRLGQGTHNFEVALSGLPAGIYVGQVKAGRRVFSRTLLKK